MENNFINTKRSLTNDDLKQFESKFNVVMPDKIKKHYLKYNGGYPERNVFKLDGNDREYAVNYFFSIGCEGGKTIEKIWPIIRDDTVFPSWLVPLADEMGGDIFAYSIRAGEEGSIYYYSHEFDYGETPLNIKLNMTIEEVKAIFGDFDYIEANKAFIYGGGIRAEFIFNKNRLERINLVVDGC